ncbi:MAG: alpha/beta hydrolase [Saccharofermentans sp.]|nr:alpha/beta hydrolase [Saccharofermentans sp.]
MNDSMRENLSYFGLYMKLFKAKKNVVPEHISFGEDKEQYFLYYEPEKVISDKIFLWVHGGGWNAGSPKFFDFVGQAMAGFGYRVISLGYRLSPKNKYPCQIEDVCMGYNAAIKYLQSKNIDISKIVVSGPSAGAHLTSILVYNESIRERMNVDISNVIGYVGVGGPYSFKVKHTLAINMLLNQLFAKDFNRDEGDPCLLMNKSEIPMLLIQSEHDGLINYSCAEDFKKNALLLGNKCELYSVEDKKNTHSWYTAGMFLEKREENKALNKLLSWMENL